MDLSILDYILSQKTREGWVCPKCGYGMKYVPVASSSMYACDHCSWIQHDTPKRGKIEVEKEKGL